MAFLDNNGLGTLWGRIKTKFGASFADLVKDSSSVTIKLQNGYGNDLDTVAIPLADSTNSKAGLMSPTEKSKLAGIAAGAEVNVQSDWNETDSTSDAYIANKPTIPTIPSNIVNKITTTAGAHTTITNATGNVSFKVPTEASHVGAVPTSRTVNGKALSSNITLKATDIHIVSQDVQWETVEQGLLTLTIGKVDKVEGKGLSTNDYTTDEKNKLAGIAAGAEVNVLEGVQINGTDLTITDKKVNVPIFTGATTSTDGTQGLVPAPVGYTLERNLKSALLGATGEWTTVNMTSTRTGSDTYQLGLTFGTSSGTNSYTNLTVPIATSSQSGLLSSGDKTKVDYVDTGKSVSTYVAEQIASAQTGSSKYKGTVGTGGTVTTLPTSGYKQGDYYVVCSEGTYAGELCEVGDMIFCNKDYASGAVAADDWDIVQSNITAMTTEEINAICA